MTLMTTLSKNTKYHNKILNYKIVSKGRTQETRSLFRGKWRFTPRKVEVYSEESGGLLGVKSEYPKIH